MIPEKRRFWSAEDHEYLVEHYGDVPIEAIAERVGRTVSAVHNRAKQYALGPNRPHDVMTLNQALIAIGDHGQHGKYIGKSGLITRGLFKAEKGTRYGTMPTWWVREADLIAFLRQHPEYVDKRDVQPPFRQYVTERYITLSEAFRRGAAYPLSLEHAVKAGTIPEARNHGIVGSKWVIPESILPRLIEGRRRFVDDAAHRRLVNAYRKTQHRQNLRRNTRRYASRYTQEARKAG